VIYVCDYLGVVFLQLYSLRAPFPWINTTCIIYSSHVVSFYTLYI